MPSAMNNADKNDTPANAWDQLARICRVRAELWEIANDHRRVSFECESREPRVQEAEPTTSSEPMPSAPASPGPTAASGPHQGRLTWEEQYDLMDAEGTFSNAEVARARARGLWKCTTVEDGLIVKRDYCKGASWARTSCLHCNQPFWKDGAQPGSVCRSCVGVTDKVCRQRRMQRRVAFLISSRCGAECDLSRLPADVLRHIGEMVQ